MQERDEEREFFVPEVEISIMPTPLQWAHLALDGGLFRLDTPNDDLAALRDDIAARLAEAFPCLGEEPEATLADGPLAAYQQWLGLQTAIAYVEMGGTRSVEPAAGDFGLVRIESEVAGIKEKLGRLEGRDLTAQVVVWRRDIQICMARVPCVKESLTQVAAKGALATRSGKRRSGEGWC